MPQVFEESLFLFLFMQGCEPSEGINLLSLVLINAVKGHH